MAADAMTAPGPRRVLVAAQGHPLLGDHGDALLAHELFTSVNNRPDCEAWFLGCGLCEDAARAGVELRGCISQPFGPSEYIYAARAIDPVRCANRDPFFPAAFADLITELAPDAVHFHGFATLGIEAIAIVRRAAPTARILLTLTDYAAICAHNGWMVTRPDLALCHAASLSACGRCFPEQGPTGIYLRERYLRHFLDQVDDLIAPSAFLRQRFIEWGVAPERIRHEAPPMPRCGPVARRAPDGFLRVGYFGPISLIQGVGVLLDAAALLDEADDRVVQFVLYGDLAGSATERAALDRRLQGTGPRVTCGGRGEPASVAQRMREVDAVVVPSLWWEASAPALQWPGIMRCQPSAPISAQWPSKCVMAGTASTLLQPIQHPLPSYSCPWRPCPTGSAKRYPCPVGTRNFCSLSQP